MNNRSKPYIEYILIAGLVLGIGLALSIPVLSKSGLPTNESEAISGLKSIFSGQEDYFQYSAPHHTYSRIMVNLGTGDGAGGEALIDFNVISGLRSGYTFYMHPGPPINGSTWTWSVTAWPLTYRQTGIRSFYIDRTGSIRGSDAGGCVATDHFPVVAE